MQTAEDHLTAAENALRGGHAREALEHARDALRTQPENAHAIALTGLAHVYMGDEIEAHEALKRAVGLAPRESRVRCLYYLALGRLRDMEGARAQLTYFVELEPHNTQARETLAKLGGPVKGLPPLPKPPAVALWYDGGGHALVDAGEIADEDAEPEDGPDVVVCQECEKRTGIGWVCKHCQAPLPRP